MEDHGQPEFPCETHENELRAIRDLNTNTREELKIVQEVLRRLEKSLFGNGRPGVIDQHEKKLAAHDKVIYIGIGALLVMQFLTGSGVVSLKAFTGH